MKCLTLNFDLVFSWCPFAYYAHEVLVLQDTLALIISPCHFVPSETSLKSIWKAFQSLIGHRKFDWRAACSLWESPGACLH